MRPAKSRLRSVVEWSIAGILMLISIEAVSQLAYRVHKGKWYWTDWKTSARTMVQPHPYLGAVPTPNASDERNGVRISHNSFRSRGPEFVRPKPDGTFRIVALGGSTTYCTGVSDDQTWEAYLTEMLGKPYEVVNLANPGGTTTEATIQTALLFSDVQPDIALYYMGWNDARVQHVKDLWPDWSDFHGKWLMAFGMSGKELTQPFASAYLFKRVLFEMFYPNMDNEDAAKQAAGTADALTGKIDPRAMSHYVRNLKNIVALCRKQGVTPIFIPQVMNYAVCTNDTPYGWLPFVKDKDLETVIGAYNETLEQVAEEENVGFIKNVMEPDYAKTGFYDQGHMTPESNKLFAREVADFLTNYLKSNPRAFTSAPSTHGQ